MDTNLEAQIQAMIAQALDRGRAENAAILEQTKVRYEKMLEVAHEENRRLKAAQVGSYSAASTSTPNEKKRELSKEARRDRQQTLADAKEAVPKLVARPASNHEEFFKTLDQVLRLKPGIQRFLADIQPEKAGLLVKAEVLSGSSSPTTTKTSTVEIDEGSAENFFVWLTVKKIGSELETLYNKIDTTNKASEQLREL